MTVTNITRNDGFEKPEIVTCTDGITASARKSLPQGSSPCGSFSVYLIFMTRFAYTAFHSQNSLQAKAHLKRCILRVIRKPLIRLKAIIRCLHILILPLNHVRHRGIVIVVRCSCAFLIYRFCFVPLILPRTCIHPAPQRPPPGCLPGHK